ncbi:FUSC family protein [Pseudonocardia pini]|uniref:FUSC family protein n=1 Tax=Pseudonocardia pini TaxID=2758030 RepID=UPI0015F042CE|nr:FUSC family protein [Pseudonocardia pini]
MTLVRELVRVAPHAGAHRPALRCAVSVGVASLEQLAVGRLDLLGAAAFGAFTAIYGRDLTVPGRTAVQALTGVGLTLSVAVGLLAAHLPGAPWVELAVLVALAGVATLVGGIVDWKPGGPLFFVFAAGAFAGAPVQPGGTVLEILATTAGAAAFSVLIGSVGAVFPTHVRARRPVAVRTAREVLRSGIVGDVVLACALTAPVAVLLGVEHLYWALIGAVVPVTAVGGTQRLARGLHRIAGTLLGLAVAAPLLAAGLPGWAIVVVAVVLQVGAELFVLRNYALALVFVTPLALVVGATMHPAATGELLTDRILATVVGVLVSLAVLALRRRERRWSP